MPQDNMQQVKFSLHLHRITSDKGAAVRFCAQNGADLIFEKEYNLNTKPLEIDKSPKDHLDIDAFYKAGAYASLYKAYGKTVDEIKADDITVSMIREARPEGLFRYFEEHGYTVANPCRGIYWTALSS